MVNLPFSMAAVSGRWIKRLKGAILITIATLEKEVKGQRNYY